jgi:benzoyl-CoA-dihydrodiol lyase
VSDTRLRFETDPSHYRHWKLDVDGPIATLAMAVDPNGGLRDDYELKLNSYDLAVDIELHDALQRLRFEHPSVKAIVITGALDKVFCAGANIQMLATSTHAHKVGFCKFTNETRNGIEEMSSESGQVVLAAVNGTAAGGGYELALACDEIVLVDDRSSAVSLPEVPLLAVLPGTGGLTRVVDKRHVRRDLADVFSTKVEGIKGKQAVEWGLVDSIAAPTAFADHVRSRALTRSAESDRPDVDDEKVVLEPLEHRFVSVERTADHATITVRAFGTLLESLEACRELDDAILDLRFNDTEIGTWVLRTEGDSATVIAADHDLDHDGWLPREVRLFWKRTLKRLEMSARTLVALVTPGSCFAGTLAELALAADRTLMLDDDGSWLQLTDANDGWYPMANGLTRLATRFWGHDDDLARARATLGKQLDAAEALEAGLVTEAPDDLDWDDEVRLLLEERASFSPDALTGMEANLRFPGPETMETKIFARLTAWQNWIFQRPNAIGVDGALKRYGSGVRATFDRGRVG